MANDSSGRDHSSLNATEQPPLGRGPLPARRHAPGPLALGIVFVLSLAGGFLVWRYFLQPQRQVILPNETNSLGMEFRRLPAGRFEMGSPAQEEDRDDDEHPHPVEITHPFWLGTREVTQEQFLQVMGFNPSMFTGEKNRPGGPDHPVENVSWDEAGEFCRRLSELPAEKEAGRRYRLPTEAEWEYACRAGLKGQRFGFGARLTERDANTVEFSRKIGQLTTPVGSHRPNRWGLEDMHGNVWEWCSDWYDADYYLVSPEQNPQGPPKGDQRVIRGGSRANEMRTCRSANRAASGPEVRLGIGLRVVMVRE